uniref:Large ribosomal subunit protein P2 n=1 Tax=Monopterus albus TaxID=43700 RepID=A0A3Q3IBT4_MONAL
MRYVAAYLLAVLGGNTSPSAKDIKAILGSVGIEADDERLNKVISELNGKDINEVMNSGKGSSVNTKCHLGGPPPLLLLAGALELGLRLLLRKRKRKRRKKNQKSQMKIWALDSLINPPSLCLKSNKNGKGLHTLCPIYPLIG